MIKMYIGFHVKYPLFSSDVNETWIFPRQVFESTPIPNFIKIHPVGVELFLAEGQTDMTKLIVAFRNFPNVPKIEMSKAQVTNRFISNCEIFVML
jgi:hypothetical protein